MAAQAVILAKHWENLAHHGSLALACHAAILAAVSHAVHRTMVRGVARNARDAHAEWVGRRDGASELRDAGAR